MKTIYSTYLAAAVALETAIPTSAFLSLGASSTPSTVMPTICTFHEATL
ncbi:hypothetical protein [Methanohalobium evestigatum]|nr:hypothetical protein [Methanohalobium evestigatum]